MNKDVNVFILSGEGKIVRRDLLKDKPYRIEIDRLKSAIYFIEQIKEETSTQHKVVNV